MTVSVYAYFFDLAVGGEALLNLVDQILRERLIGRSHIAGEEVILQQELSAAQCQSLYRKLDPMRELSRCPNRVYACDETPHD